MPSQTGMNECGKRQMITDRRIVENSARPFNDLCWSAFNFQHTYTSMRVLSDILFYIPTSLQRNFALLNFEPH